jgi:hypothetical protein
LFIREFLIVSEDSAGLNYREIPAAHPHLQNLRLVRAGVKVGPGSPEGTERP